MQNDESEAEGRRRGRGEVKGEINLDLYQDYKKTIY